jgi:hypothetical protein
MEDWRKKVCDHPTWVRTRNDLLEFLTSPGGGKIAPSFQPLTQAEIDAINQSNVRNPIYE